MEQLALDCFNNPFKTDTGNQENSIPPLDEVDEGEAISTCRIIHFTIYSYPSAAVRTIYDITLNST